jgi:rhodanese-related sulfurtransferase
MARVIDRNEVRRLVEKESAQLVEVLPREEYESEHIAGALNLPLPELNAESAMRLDESRPVIAYCHDFQ